MKKSNRTKNTIYNTSSNIVSMFLKYLLTFISKTFFIKYLGEVYLGVNELLINILYMLSIAELGLSTAIGFSLYEPIAKNDKRKINVLMTFFKKAYYYIGILIAIIGTAVYFFLPFIIKEYNEINDIFYIYFLYLFNTSFNYFISYKEVLIVADQKSYKLTRINIISLIISFILELIALIALKSFIFYLIFRILVQIIQRLITNKYIGKEYHEIIFNSKEKLDEKTQKEIKKNVKGLIFHKIGDYAVNGTDNLIISYFLNIVTVGIFSNYILITKVIQNILAAFYNSVIPSFGNLIVESSNKKSLEIFERLDFFGFTLYCLFSTIFISCANPFISIWLGKKFLLPQVTVYLISFSFFLTGIRMASFSVKSSAGIFKEDSWSPFLQSIINLIFSIVLCKFIGLNGIIIGTILSSFVPILTRIYYVYKLVFKEKVRKYIVSKLLLYVSFFIVINIVIINICNLIKTFAIIKLITNLLVTLIIYVLFYLLCFARNKNYKYLIYFSIKMFSKREGELSEENG